MAPPVSSALKKSFKPPMAAPMTSPVRPSASTLATTAHPSVSTAQRGAMRNTAWGNNTLGAIAASSPGGYAQPMHAPPPPSDNFNPVPPTPKRDTQGTPTVPELSPNTAIRRILGTNSAVPSLDMPLSDDGAGVSGDNSTMFDWSADLSAFFDVEGFSMDNANASLGMAATDAVGSEKTEGEDDVLSQLFNRTSSAMVESSPHSFDFSQLPPSSPPVLSSDLPHSALLLSSPDLSPMDRKLSPMKKGYTPSSGKPTPTDMSSVLTNPAPTPLSISSTAQTGAQSQEDQDKELKAFLATHQFDVNALEELWRMTNGDQAQPQKAVLGATGTAGPAATSSTTEAEGVLAAGSGGADGGDFFAMLEKNFAQV